MSSIMKRLISICLSSMMFFAAYGQQMSKSVNLAESTIVYSESDASLVKHMAEVLADDIARVSGVRT